LGKCYDWQGPSCHAERNAHEQCRVRSPPIDGLVLVVAFYRAAPRPRWPIGNIESMHITNGTVSADVEYTEHEDGTWSFKLTFEDDPVSVESVDSFPAKELAEEQVNYELQAASLRIAEG
jgi:hypothetical protein